MRSVGGHRGAHGQEFQAHSFKASAFHDRFIAGLKAPPAGTKYQCDIQAANAALVDTAATGASELGVRWAHGADF